MKRRVFAAVSSISLVLLLATTASWIRSYWLYDQVAYGTLAHGRWTWSTYGVPYSFTRWPPERPKGASHTLLTCFGKIYFRQDVHHTEAPEPGSSARDYSWASDENIIPSFSALVVHTADMSGSGWWTLRQVTVRHWAIVVILSCAPVAWLRASRRERSPAQANKASKLTAEQL